MRSSIAPLVAVLIVAGLSTPILAQTVLFKWAPPPEMALGSAAAVGDFDGDGRGDFAFTQPTYSTSERGRVLVHSGLTGARLFERVSPVVGDGLGAVVAGLGDVDGDGLADIVVASHTEVFALRGGSGALLWRITAAGMTAITAVPDLDLDGVPDWAGGARVMMGTGVGSVRLYSGRAGAVLSTITPPPGASAYFGESLALIGDFDLDGRPDLAVGDSYGGVFGSVSVHGLAQPTLIRHLQAVASPFGTGTTGFGFAVASPGDIDGDSIPELLVGSPYELLATPGTHGGPTGRVRLLSGASGVELLAFTQSTYGAGFGIDVGTYPDLDGDGRAELWMSAWARRTGCCVFLPGELRIHSSATGAPLFELFDFGATRATTVPDINGDGFVELLAAQEPAHGSPTRLVLPFADPVVGIPGCAPKITSQNCVPLAGHGGVPSLSMGDDLWLWAAGVMPGAVGVFLFGSQPAATPFGGGTLCVGGAVRRSTPQPIVGSGVCAPSFTLAVPKPMLATLTNGPGSHLYVQGWFRDAGFPAPNDIGLTSGFGLTIWP